MKCSALYLDSSRDWNVLYRCTIFVDIHLLLCCSGQKLNLALAYDPLRLGKDLDLDLWLFNTYHPLEIVALVYMVISGV